MKKLAFIVFLLIAITVSAQDTSVIEAQQLERAYAEICKTDKIYMFGYDFTGFKLIDVTRAGKDEKMKIFISEIIQKMNKRNLEKDFAQWFDKDSVLFEQDAVNKRNETIIKSKTLGTEFEYKAHKIPSDSLPIMISRYQTGNMEGMGFVQIVECFLKEKNEVSVWYVFFDIKSKRIIDNIKLTSHDAGGHPNFPDYWAKGVKSSLDFYVREYYPDIKKACKKIK